MNGYLIAEEGPFAGLVIRLEDGDEWVLGRDPEVTYQVLEDPMVSRKHVILRREGDGFILENLSAVNPARVNGEPVTDPAPLSDGDTVQVGNVLLRFSNEAPGGGMEMPLDRGLEESTPTMMDEKEQLDAFTFTGDTDTRWMLKIISGPNSGGELSIARGTTHVVGKDPNSCDFVFQDLSVSRQHARIACDENEQVTIEDMGSKNGVLVNGLKITETRVLKPQDLVALGTTSFLVIDRQESRETIVSPASMAAVREDEPTESKEAQVRKWKQTIIPTRHLILATAFLVFMLIAVGGTLSLFKSEKVEIVQADNPAEVEKVLEKFPGVQFSLNDATGTIFLLGNVISDVEHQEMIYMVQSLPFILNIEDNVVIDELVWESTNAMIAKNPQWRGVSVISVAPGKFVLRGYIETSQEAAELDDFIVLNFPYLENLVNEVVVEKTLNSEVQAILIDRGFMNVTFQLANGELILAGRVSTRDERQFKGMIEAFNQVKGVKEIKSFVVFTEGASSIIDISGKYTVTGNSKFGNVSQFVVIDGKILARGDVLDGMVITDLESNTVLLEKDGLKFKINYNQQ